MKKVSKVFPHFGGHCIKKFNSENHTPKQIGQYRANRGEINARL